MTRSWSGGVESTVLRVGFLTKDRTKNNPFGISNCNPAQQSRLNLSPSKPLSLIGHASGKHSLGGMGSVRMHLARAGSLRLSGIYALCRVCAYAEACD